MLFSELTIEFQEIEKTTLRNEMMRRLADILKRAEKEEVKELVYLAMGELRPKFDRLEFNLADKMVVRAIARACGKSAEAIMQEYKEKGDLGEVVEENIRTRQQTNKSINQQMNVRLVYEELTKIAEDMGTGSQERKIDRLSRLLASMDATAAKYIVRIVLGKLRLGFSDKTILDALSYMESGNKESRERLDQAYQLAPDVGELAELVKAMGAKKAREAVAVVLGRPVTPALAQRLRTADEMIEKMGTVAVEPKYDGTRVQIHVSKTKREENNTDVQNGLFGEEEKPKLWVKTFTRNLDENTDMFPELQRIAGQIQADEVILDSEAVGYDPKTGAMVPFQMTITRKRKHGIDLAVSSVPLKFYVFDILYKDGTSLVDMPLRERRKILEKTIVNNQKTKETKDNDVLVVDEVIIADDPGILRKFHKEQLDKGLEGALVKKIDGKYLPGRQDFNWVKFKEEEGTAGKLSDTVDGIVMGYYKGKGKRSTFGVGAFLMGIRDDGQTNKLTNQQTNKLTNQQTNKPTNQLTKEKVGRIVTLAKIGTGLSDEQFRELHSKLTNQQTNEKDEAYVVDKMLTPDVWVKPEIVVEVAADEVTKSPVHSSGYALRFPRLERFRDDKKADEATTLTELKEIAGV